LQKYGAVPVLYASQWFLTIYSCPFPATFACRVIDVMLTEHSSNVLMRAALAVLAECEDDLLQLHDFEDLITYLKVGMSCGLPLLCWLNVKMTCFGCMTLKTSSHTSRWERCRLSNPELSILIQKGHSYTGNPNSETPGDRKSGFCIVKIC